ncbi:MAG: M48 family metalloprotease [Bdellovibrionia bacterium]
MKNILIRLPYRVFILGLIFLAAGCATQPSLKLASPDEIWRRDQAVGSEIAQQFESRLSFKNNPEVSIYLRKLATALLEVTPDLQGSSVGIWLIRSKKGKWKSYALPGNRIYLSTGLLHELEFENEIAAEISIQYSHLIQKHALERFLRFQDGKTDSSPGSAIDNEAPWKNSPAVEYFGLNGVFAFSEEAEISAAKMAIGILYRAGYDPRGLISLFDRFKNNSKHSPYEMSTINKIIEQARHELALQAPLRNPIVRSPAFIRIQKRIRDL